MKTNLIVTLLILLLTSPVYSSSNENETWEIPHQGHNFSFPKDNGSHPKFKIEWWYITGHLSDSLNHNFGYQATFFRVAGPNDFNESTPNFGHSQLYLAHMALTDVSNNSFISEERLNRNGWNAYSSPEALDIKNGNWSLLQTDFEHNKLTLFGSIRSQATFELELQSLKPLVVFGQDSVSRKGSDPSASSYYLTFSKLSTQGTLNLEGKNFNVSGISWMDHEISSSQLSKDLVGWDWTCIQFDNSDFELMLYRLRKSDGTSDPYSQLQWVDKAGRTINEPFKWKVLSMWKSKQSETTYPSIIQLETIDPRTKMWIKLIISPEVLDQELITSLGGGTYWEGTCLVKDEQGNILGKSYLELTGYLKPIKL
jgi:predicted secreted hydrolase